MEPLKKIDLKIDLKINLSDLITIAGNDHICKQPMKRSFEVEREYLKFRKNGKFNLILKNSYLIQLNDFPYNVKDDIIHYTMWLDNFEYSNFEIQQIINFEFKGYQNVVWFINSENLRSVNNIYHVHIFVK